MFRLLSFLFVGAALCVSVGPARAQLIAWQATTGQPGSHLPSDSVTSIAINGSGHIFAAVSRTDGFYDKQPVTVYRSSNGGYTWDSIPQAMNDQGGGITLGPVYGFSSRNGKVYMGGGLGGRVLYHSNEDGSNVTPDSLTPDRGSDPASINAVAFAPNGAIYVAAGGGGMYTSDLTGKNWSLNGVNLPDDDQHPTYVVCSPMGILFAANAHHVVINKQKGGGWQPISGAFGNAISFAFDGAGNIVAGGANGLFRSVDNGDNWTQLTSPVSSSSSYALAVTGNGIIFCAPNDGSGNGIYVSIDNGGSWTQINSGLTNTFVDALAIDNQGFVYAGTGNGIYRSVISADGVKPIGGDIPSSFSLEQNHPNPVNSSTTIRFAIPESELVSLRVYDETGKERAVLADKMYQAGTYDVNFDASTLKTGIYYYRIEAGGFSQTRSFVVLP